MKPAYTRHSANVLLEAADIQERKSQDYQNPLSRVRQADHYPRGVNSILDVVNTKVLRMYSVLETMEQHGKINFESVEDSALDAINYLSFIVAYMRGEIDGQSPDRDIFNRRVTEATHPTQDLIPTKFRKEEVESTTFTKVVDDISVFSNYKHSDTIDYSADIRL